MIETLLSLCIGIGLSAACGFRVFVPLLVMSIASLMGWFEPMKGFEWLAIPSVCIGLAVATVCEIGAYYIPWVDNALDTIATPAAMVAGTLTTMAVSSGEMSQFASWAAAIIVGEEQQQQYRWEQLQFGDYPQQPQVVSQILSCLQVNGSEQLSFQYYRSLSPFWW